MEEIDFYVGRILQFLKESGLEENTIVWFMSDNGPWLIKNEEGGSAGLFRDGKGSTWEGGVRVPCFVQWPKYLHEQINESMINVMDVYATSIKLGGGEIPSDRPVDGIDVTSLLIGDSSVNSKEQIPFFYYGIDHNLMAVRLGSWKLHVKTYSQLGIDYFNGKQLLLFNVENDPSEKYDLSDEHSDIVRELQELIDKQIEKIKIEGSFYD